MSDGDDSVMLAMVGFLLFGVVLVVVVIGRSAWRHPKLAALLAIAGGGWWALRYPILWAPTIVTFLVVAVWCVATRHRLKGAARRRRYRRSWGDVCAAHRLSWAPHPKVLENTQRQASYWELVTPGRNGSCPKLGKIRTGEWMDELEVRMLPGQTPDDWDKEVEGIAHAVGARDGRIRVDRPGRIKVELAYGDPLAVVIEALAITPRTDLGVIPIGLYEDGATWFVRLAGSHILICGVTGSGKGSVIWSIVRALCPAVRTGMVEVWAIDPKGGMELGPGRPLFARFAADDFEAMAVLLEEAVEAMRARARRLAGVHRIHGVTPEEPLVVILIDELANLTAYLPNRQLRDRISQALAVLLTQGRAVGFVVVAAIQDPKKDVVTQRNLFPTRVALRLDEPVQVSMVLGDGARDQGALCDKIPEFLPGVGFVKVDGEREPRRVRAAFVSDSDIAEMVDVYGRGEDRPALEVVR